MNNVYTVDATTGTSHAHRTPPSGAAHELVSHEELSIRSFLAVRTDLEIARERIQALEEKLRLSEERCSMLERTLDHTTVLLDSETATREEMEKHAGIDILTGIMNRRALLQGAMKILHEELRKDDLDKQYVSLLFIDADHFKKINDAYGHSMGDMVLKKLAQRLDAIKRYEDVVGRYGGEEFLYIIPHKHSDDIATLANRIIEEVRKIEVPYEKGGVHMNPLKVTISIGVHTFQLKNNTETHVNSSEAVTAMLGDILDESIKNADAALYIAKKTGRDRICYHD